MKQKGDYLPEYIGGKCPVMKEYAIEQSKTNNRQLQRKQVEHNHKIMLRIKHLQKERSINMICRKGVKS
jgi:hypothetical protein